MILWRNVFIALVISAWAHGMAAGVLFTVGLSDIAGFCVFASIVSGLALMPVGAAAQDQSNSYMLERAMEAEKELRRLRAELYSKES